MWFDYYLVLVLNFDKTSSNYTRVTLKIHSVQDPQELPVNYENIEFLNEFQVVRYAWEDELEVLYDETISVHEFQNSLKTWANYRANIIATAVSEFGDTIALTENDVNQDDLVYSILKQSGQAIMGSIPGAGGYINRMWNIIELYMNDNSGTAKDSVASTLVTAKSDKLSKWLDTMFKEVIPKLGFMYQNDQKFYKEVIEKTQKRSDDNVPKDLENARKGLKAVQNDAIRTTFLLDKFSTDHHDISIELYEEYINNLNKSHTMQTGDQWEHASIMLKFDNNPLQPKFLGASFWNTDKDGIFNQRLTKLYTSSEYGRGMDHIPLLKVKVPKYIMYGNLGSSGATVVRMTYDNKFIDHDVVAEHIMRNWNKFEQDPSIVKTYSKFGKYYEMPNPIKLGAG